MSTSSRHSRCYFGSGNEDDLRSLPVQTQTELRKFSLFLVHHPNIGACTCGVPLRRDGNHLLAQPSTGCDCPCHIPGYVSASTPLVPSLQS